MQLQATEVKNSQLVKVDSDPQIIITRFVSQVCCYKRPDVHWPTARNHWKTLLQSALQPWTWSETFSRCWWNELICCPVWSLRTVFSLCLSTAWAHLSLSQEKESCGLPIWNKQEQACGKVCVMHCWGLLFIPTLRHGASSQNDDSICPALLLFLYETSYQLLPEMRTTLAVCVQALKLTFTFLTFKTFRVKFWSASISFYSQIKFCCPYIDQVTICQSSGLNKPSTVLMKTMPHTNRVVTCYWWN